MSGSARIVIVGAGVFGVAAALELRARGHQVTLLDPGPLPHRLAASTDISKVIRLEYGSDEAYMTLAERAREGWLHWNERWRTEGADPLYHETGVLMVRRDAMEPEGFEYESFRLLRQRGHEPERLDAEVLARRFPMWSTGHYIDGFFDPEGGYAESGRVVDALLRWAEREGVQIVVGPRVRGFVERGAGVVGVRDETARTWTADFVVAAAGAWTSKLVPDLQAAIAPTGHPVFHLQPADGEPFRPERFPVFTADISTTGFYGFPLHADGVVKIGNHGPGLPIDPDAPRAVPQAATAALREFLAGAFPALAGAPVVATRLCLYADTQDGDFWIARDPERTGLTVASGGSGHGFKFAPVLGGLIADAVEGRTNPMLDKFRWRPEVRLAHGREAARHHGARRSS